MKQNLQLTHEVITLKVGDKIYPRSYRSFKYGGALIIDRITNKMAFSGSLKFKIEVPANGKLWRIGEPSYSNCCYFLESDEILEKVELNNMRGQLQSAMQDISGLSIDQIKGILKIINTTT